MKNIFLVGMPASGKSSLGKILAQNMDLKFLDLDQIIVKKEVCTIEEIFRKKGEEAFRKIERKALMKTFSKKKPFVLATGGGAPCFFDNMELMSQHGITVYLDVSLENLFQKLLRKGTEKRPLLKGLTKDQLYEELRSKYEYRQNFYKKADISVEQHFEERQKTVDRIIEALKISEKYTAA
jgi:shikimate kinase